MIGEEGPEFIIPRDRESTSRIAKLERQLDRLERRDRAWWWIGGLLGAVSGGLAWLVMEVIV